MRKPVGSVICVASAKGGSGKSTIATALGVRASADGDVALLDVDPQASLADWWGRRKKPNNPRLVTITGGMGATVERLRREGYDWIVIDTPPSRVEDTIKPSIAVSDFVLIPIQTTAFDITAVASVVALCKQENKPFAFVLNRVEARSRLTEQATDVLRRDGDVLDAWISNRESYRAAITDGMTGAESKDTKAREEIDALWRLVRQRASGAVKTGGTHG